MENFKQLLEESFQNLDMRSGAIMQGIVVNITPNFVVVNVGLKTEGLIPLQQFQNDKGELEVEIGKEVTVALDAIEDGFGETRLSREKAKKAEAWMDLTKAYEQGRSILGTITGKVKGGFTVEVQSSLRAFLPGSLVDVRPVRETNYLEGRELEFKVIKIDRQKNNLVLSRRSVIEEENREGRDLLLRQLDEGQEVKGIVKNLTDYGAFIDLGGIDGLLHITDMSWKRVKHPSEVLFVGQELEVKVLRFDRDKNRVSLGLKQMGNDPWLGIALRYPQNSRIKGIVTNLTDYGCFVEIETGVEGLVHVSEMDWTNKNAHPNKIVSVGQEIDVMVLEIDGDRRRISLGIKQCIENPWQLFSNTHNKGDRVSGKIKSITDFGIFIGLDGNIDGLIHLSDITWKDNPEEALKNYKKGDLVEAVVLSVDPERERIALGIKQLQTDPYVAAGIEKGNIVKGTITEIDPKGMTLDLGNSIQGYIRISELSRERVDNIQQLYKVGDIVEAKVLMHDKKTRLVSLSIKAKDVADEAQALEGFNRSSEGESMNSLGSLLRDKIESSKLE